MESIQIINANRTVQFTNTPEGWEPTWFFEGDRPMLRFKDHQWLSIGDIKPRFARQSSRTPTGGVIFSDHCSLGKTLVQWSVSIEPDPSGPGFIIDSSFTPEASLELLEAWSSFETPYEYDGHETVTTTIGMNPVSQWKGTERITPPTWANPAWIYARPQSVRMTAPSNAPFLCQAITSAGAIPDRYITFVGDWNTCPIKDLFATPTRDVPLGPPSPFGNHADLRGYKYLVGALNWSSSYAKDPNVLFPAGVAQHQRLIISFSNTLPGESLDAMFYRAWERASLLDLPADGRVHAFDAATSRNVSWRAATNWLRNAFTCDQPTDGLYHPGKGICTYAIGTRPKGGNGDYSMGWWPQWAGPLHYRARMTADAELQDTCNKLDKAFSATSAGARYFEGIAVSVAVLPAIAWIHSGGRGGVLQTAMAPAIQNALARSVAENGKQRTMDYGAQASIAEALLMGSEIYESVPMREQALILLDEMAKRLDTKFWEFNVGPAGNLWHGGQIRSLGHGHAIVANLIAFRQTGDRQYLAHAHRFARFLLSISYATHNSSHDPDFDLRGWCNGSNAGRDQIAEAPPWETQNGLLCISSLMDTADLEPGFYDTLWYIARTGLAQFPAARTLKRILDLDYRPHYIPRDQIATERDFYDCLPYLAYENPYDQTLLASYQGTDCLLGELVYGGGLATVADTRLGVVVPRAATMDMRELHERVVHLWNPLQTPITTTVTAHWPDGSHTTQAISVPGRQRIRVCITH